MSKNIDMIVSELDEMIGSKKFKINEKLPSEIVMAKYFNVSRMTYRAAVKKMQDEGKLYIKHGSGTFVVPSLPKIESSIDKLESIGKMINRAGFVENEEQESLEFLIADKEVAKALNLKTGAKVVKFKRFRTADNEAIAYSINYMPYSLCGKAFEEIKFSGSLFKYLHLNCNIEIICADSEFCIPQDDNPVVKKLHTEETTKIMLIKQLHYSTDNIPVLYSYDYLRNDIFDFKIRRRV